jgi:hypothetical protein
MQHKLQLLQLVKSGGLPRSLAVRQLSAGWPNVPVEKHVLHVRKLLAGAERKKKGGIHQNVTAGVVVLEDRLFFLHLNRPSSPCCQRNECINSNEDVRSRHACIF